ncbi:MAG: NUDIX hydrolase [Nitrospirota bacterium]|nr:NUDIX hydrolase [Nitrospirota bacterium]
MIKPAALKTQVSSGGVIFRRYDGSLEVAMVAVKGGNVWCLPKGLIDKGEVPEKTAIREVAEETGLKGRIIEKLGEITYWYYIKEENIKRRKTVHFFLMEYEGGDVSNHDWEVDDASWFLIDEALKKASYRGEKEIIEKARKKLIDGKDIKLE